MTIKSDLCELAICIDIRNKPTGLLVHTIIAMSITICFDMWFFEPPNHKNQLVVGMAITLVLFFSYILTVKCFYGLILPNRRDAQKMTDDAIKSSLLGLVRFFDIREPVSGPVHIIMSAVIISLFLNVLFDSQKIDAPYVWPAMFVVLYFSYLLAAKYFYDWMFPSRWDA